MSRHPQSESDRIKLLLEAALGLPEEERALFLRRECGVDEELLREIESLVEAAEGDSSFLEERVAVPETLLMPAGEAASDEVPEKIGPYRLVRTLGAGGMGTVYLAERDDPEFRQQVALKLIRRDQTSDNVLQRFVQERQILAGLQHENVARLLDGGATDDGTPYFVMEHVDGLALLTYCDRNRLGVDARLGLFLEVCAAVEYAHRNLVVHRDIKPGNILVTPEGRAKLLDFGIAKVLTPSQAVAGAQTQTQGRVLTVPYASPEQIRGEPITTASDIFSLGVVLYELLVGRRPFAGDETDVYELSKSIVEADPARPSTMVGDSIETTAADQATAQVADEMATRRRANVKALRRRLRGDLDSIVLKALRKVPAERYLSVARLADDIRNHLEGRPVDAAEATFSYRAKKFVRRHAAALSLTIALLGLAIAAGVFHTVQVTRERDRARIEARRSATVSDFLVDLFEVSDPGVARGRELTAREILDRGANQLERSLKGEPEVKARLFGVVGKVYQRLGEYDAAEGAYDRSLELLRELDRQSSAAGIETLETKVEKASLLIVRAELDEAERLIRETLEEIVAREGDDSLLAARAYDALGTVLQESGKYQDALPLFEQSLAIRRLELGSNDALVSVSANNLAFLYVDLRRYLEAEPLLREAIEIDRAILGSPHPELAMGLTNLATVLLQQYREGEPVDLAEAEQHGRTALDMMVTVLGEDHPQVALVANDLARIVGERGDLDQAEALFRQALTIQEKTLGRHPMVAVALSNLGGLLVEKGELDQAEAAYQRSLATNRELLGDEHPDTAFQLQGLGNVYTLWQRPEEAIAAYRRATEIRRTSLGESHSLTTSSLVGWARSLVANGEPEKAAALLEEARAAAPELPTLEELVGA